MNTRKPHDLVDNNRKNAEWKRMILYLSPLGYTGLAYYDYSLCRSLSEEGIAVELCTSDKWILEQHEANFRINRIYKNCSGEISKIIKGMNYIIASIRIFKRSMEMNSKIVHFQIVELPMVDLFLMLALKLAGKYIVFTPHDIIHNKKYPLNRIIMSALYSLADRVVAHKSVNMKNLMSSFGVPANKIRVISHGGYEYFVKINENKDTARKRLKLHLDDRILLFIGNIKMTKGIDLLIKALPYAKGKIRDLKLVIAGKLSGISEEWLKNSISEQGVTGEVVLRIGFIQENELALYYKAADVVALPYISVSESGVLRYAQTFGKPVICSNLEEFADSVIDGETGYVFRSGDKADLARKIVHAFSSDRLEDVGHNAKKLIEEKYGWKKIAVLTKQMYDELIDQSDRI